MNGHAMTDVTHKFLGTYTTQVDNSNRIVVPKELRLPFAENEGGSTEIFVRVKDDILEIYPSWEWQALVEEIEQ